MKRTQGTKTEKQIAGLKRSRQRWRTFALVSFAYALLTNDCASAAEAVGLDSYVGFLHTDRPGRASLMPAPILSTRGSRCVRS